MTSATKPTNVAICQPVIPEYRIPFFTALHHRPEIRVEVFASMSAPGSPNTPQQDFEFPFHPVTSNPLLKGKLSWQSGLHIAQHYGKGDVLVICGNPRYLSNYPLILIAKKRGLGVVWWGQGHTPGSRQWSENIRKCLMRLADVVLLYTDKEVSQFLEAGFSGERLFATNNTIYVRDIEDAKEFWTSDRLIQFQLENKLHPNKTFLFCGRITRKTEIQVALNAIAILKNRKYACRLIIVGDGPLKEALMTRATDLMISHKVQWTGQIYHQIDLAPWFLSSIVLVFPGAIGLSLLHAFAYGLPVLTHDCEALHGPEFGALRDGHNGLLFRKGDAEDLAIKIEELGNNPKKRMAMSANALSTIQNEYSFPGMVNRFVKAVAAASSFGMSKP